MGRGGPSFSAKPALPGDVISKVNEDTITSTKDLVEVSRRLRVVKTNPSRCLSALSEDSKIAHGYKDWTGSGRKPTLEAWKPWVGVSTQVLTRELSEALALPRTT